MNYFVWGYAPAVQQIVGELGQRYRLVVRADSAVALGAVRSSGADCLIIEEPSEETCKELCFWVMTSDVSLIVARREAPPNRDTWFDRLASLSHRVAVGSPDPASLISEFAATGASPAEAVSMAESVASGWGDDDAPTLQARTRARAFLSAVREGDIDRALRISDEFSSRELSAVRDMVVSTTPDLLLPLMETDDPQDACILFVGAVRG